MHPLAVRMNFKRLVKQEEGLRVGEALQLVRKARPSACPNAGFMRQLAALARAQVLAGCGSSHDGGHPGGVRDIC